MSRLVVLLACLLLAGPAAQGQEPPAALWQALAEGGHVALMRHAEAPGIGDPESFRLDDCATQRVLDAGGREQARRTGALFRAAGLGEARVYTSRWCRCRETARLLDLGPVTDLPSLDSFFRAPGRRDEQSAATRAFLAALPPGAPVVLVTHQVNITALTGVVPRSGEIVVARLKPDGSLAVAGRLGPVD